MTIEKVLCLAEELDRRYAPATDDVVVFIFTSRRAAELFDASGMNLEAGDFRRDLRAIFERSRGKRSLTITPIGVAPPYFEPIGAGIIGPTVYNTRFELPVAAAPSQCRLEVAGRCLIALAPVTYPLEGLARRVSGTITLTGTASRDGTVTAAPIVPVGGGQAGEDSALARAALSNLATWRVEPARREDTFRVTYSYIIDSSLKAGEVDVQFALPNQVTIRANPTP